MNCRKRKLYRAICQRCTIVAFNGYSGFAMWSDSPQEAMDLALACGWQRLPPAEGDGLICKTCAAKRDLPKLDADLATADGVARGLAKDMAKGKP